MSTNQSIQTNTIQDTVCGTALTVIVNVGSTDILKTVILAAVGAVVSFTVSMVLKWLIKRFK